MVLTKGWKLAILGAIVALIGWVVWGISIFLSIWSDYYLLYTSATFGGIIIIGVASLFRYVEKRDAKEQAMKSTG